MVQSSCASLNGCAVIRSKRTNADQPWSWEQHADLLDGLVQVLTTTWEVVQPPE